MATTEYASLDELRSRLVDDQTEDHRLVPALVAASRYIDGWCGRRFWQDDLPVTSRVFETTNTRRLDLGGHDISTTTGLAVATDTDDDGVYETTLTLGTHFRAWPVNSYAPSGEVWPITRLQIVDAGGEWFPMGYGRATVQITARWGWPAVPAPVKQACLTLAQDIWKTKDLAFGGGGDSFFGRFASQPNTIAATLLAPYRHGSAIAGVA